MTRAVERVHSKDDAKKLLTGDLLAGGTVENDGVRLNRLQERGHLVHVGALWLPQDGGKQKVSQ